jgi:prevent-host-death family protein
MSNSINLADAKAHFSALVERAAAGEEIVIAKGGKPKARLVPLPDPPKRSFGIAKHWPEIPEEILIAPMSENELRWVEGRYNTPEGITKSRYLPGKPKHEPRKKVPRK